MKFKKAISPIVATALLLIVAVLSITGFQSWYNTYQSGTLANVEEQSRTESQIIVESLVGNMLYLKTDIEQYIKQIKVNGENCEIKFDIVPGVNELDIGLCLNNLSSNEFDIVIETESEIIEFENFNENYCKPDILKSCNEINKKSCHNGDGTYLIDTDGIGINEPFPVYCIMGTEGWSLALRANPYNDTLKYSSNYWIDDVTLNPSKTNDFTSEHKNQIFSTMNFTQIMLLFNTNGVKKTLIINKTANSLKEIFNGPLDQVININRSIWITLIPNSNILQLNCNVAAFNSGTRARIGLETNNENQCDSSDSYLGIGLRPATGMCGGIGTLTFVSGVYNFCTNESQASFSEIYIK